MVQRIYPLTALLLNVDFFPDDDDNDDGDGNDVDNDDDDGNNVDNDDDDGNDDDNLPLWVQAGSHFESDATHLKERWN